MTSVKCNKMIRVIGYGHLEKGEKDKKMDGTMKGKVCYCEKTRVFW